MKHGEVITSCYRCVHEIPGRFRLRVDPERYEDLAPKLRGGLFGLPGIRNVRVNPDCHSLIVEHDQRRTAKRLMTALARMSLDDVSETDAPPPCEEPSSWMPLGLSTAALVLGLMESAVAPWLLAAASLPIFSRAYEAVVGKGRLNVDVLDAAATAVLTLQGQAQTAASMVWLVSLGDAIRDVTMRQSQRAISGLMDGQKRYAWLLQDGKKIQVPVAHLREGHHVVVYPGELIPVDGSVISGTATVDQKVLTGESAPILKSPGDEVFAATVVRDGKLYLKTTKVGGQTAAARIVKLVHDAPTRDTRIQNYAERFADHLVPFSFVGAGLSFAVTANVNTAASLLIVDYGTGIRVAAPTTILSAMTKAAKRGIFIKGGRFLELLTQIDTIVFDKTGTLTFGTPDVLDIISYGVPEDDVLTLAAAAEERYNHPVAVAIVRAARQRRLPVPERSGSDYRIGLGVEATVGGETILVGCRRWMLQHGVDDELAGPDVERINGGPATPVYVARNGRLIGMIIYEDPVRPEAADVIRALKTAGVRDIVMLTGDHPAVAKGVATRLGITQYFADLLPEQKLEFVESRQKEGHIVAVVGDGINDSPALAQADVGIAVRGGTDVARETADVALLEGNLWKITDAIETSREGLALVDQNWNLIAYPNTVAIALSLFGLIGPVGATLISNGSAIVATINALRPLWSGTSSDHHAKQPGQGDLHCGTDDHLRHGVMKAVDIPVDVGRNGTGRVRRRSRQIAQSTNGFQKIAGANVAGIVVDQRVSGNGAGLHANDARQRA
jgi:Cu2+-exporting ATPase